MPRANRYILRGVGVRPLLAAGSGLDREYPSRERVVRRGRGGKDTEPGGPRHCHDRRRHLYSSRAAEGSRAISWAENES